MFFLFIFSSCGIKNKNSNETNSNISALEAQYNYKYCGNLEYRNSNLSSSVGHFLTVDTTSYVVMGANSDINSQISSISSSANVCAFTNTQSAQGYEGLVIVVEALSFL